MSYELGKISSGKAAKLAGINKVDFSMRMEHYKISPSQVELKEILEELQILPYLHLPLQSFIKYITIAM